MEPSRFSLGQVVATPGVIAAAEASGDNLLAFVARHHGGDWGELDAHDRRLNDESVVLGGRILSVYTLKDGQRIYVITEGEDDDRVRQATTVLLRNEY